MYNFTYKKSFFDKHTFTDRCRNRAKLQRVIMFGVFPVLR